MVRTRLTEVLHVEHPVMLAGMGGVAYSALTAAVSNAGGYGCLGASTMTTSQLVDELAATRALTTRPFGVDLLTAFPEHLLAHVEIAIEGGASAFVAGLGVPRPAIDLCHDHGVLVVSLCGTVEHARRARDAGVDVVVAQGTEAGGHTGRIATLPLVPMIVDAVGDTVPVVAAGGIFDGRGLAAALALGADGVWVGTRFIATVEARTVAGFKEAVVAADERATVISRAFTGKTLRALRNDTTDRYERDPTLLRPFPEQLFVALGDGTFHLGGDERTPGVDPHREVYPAGQSVGAIREVVPAADVVRAMVRDAHDTLTRLSRASRGPRDN